MIEKLYSHFLSYPFVCTDTRDIKQGAVFFALKGDNFNGNVFASQALQAGAAYAVIDEVNDVDDDNFIKVDDVLSTLQLLAKYHREQFSIPFIGITGSNGKTSTKHLIHAALRGKMKGSASPKSFNNEIGVPVTLAQKRVRMRQLSGVVDLCHTVDLGDRQSTIAVLP